MKETIEKSYEIVGSVDNAWKLLSDIPKLASCLPGAEITNADDDNNYEGIVKARVGPALMTFNGKVTVENIDAENYSIKMVGSGKDIKGTSSAELSLNAHLEETDSGCLLKGSADVSVTGKLASLGGRMINTVADQILNQFGKNFTNNVLAMGEGEVAEEAREEIENSSQELNALAFAWTVFVAWLKGFFKR